MPISISSDQFALRYEVPNFLPRGGHLFMYGYAYYYVLQLYHSRSCKCRLRMAVRQCFGCGQWGRSMRSMNEGRVTRVMLRLGPELLPGDQFFFTSTRGKNTAVCTNFLQSDPHTATCADLHHACSCLPKASGPTLLLSLYIHCIYIWQPLILSILSASCCSSICPWTDGLE